MVKIKYYLWNRKGLNTVEVVVILAVVLGLALLFRNEIVTFVNDLIKSVFNPDIPDQVDPLNMTPIPTSGSN